MKKLVFVSCVAGIIALSACEEKGPAINFGSSATLGDTTYMASTEQASSKKVVVEEFTGASCPNCPAARDMLKTIADQNPDRLILLELHPKEVPQGKPIIGESKYNFNNSYVTDIINLFFPGIGSVPIAGIDRALKNGERLIDRTAWAGMINTRLGMKSVANLNLSSSYDDAKREGVLTVKVAYTSDVTAKQYISLAVLEDDIEDVQEYPDSISHHYVFHHVFRKLLTPASGNLIIDSLTTKTVGRVYVGYYKYTMDVEWKPENCKLVAFLHNNASDSKEILQAEQVKVKN